MLFLIAYRKPSRHKRKIKSASRVIAKLNSFDHNGQKINYLRKIDPFVFEELLLTSFKTKGFKIKRNTRYTGDGGIDGTIYDSNGHKILIQAKRYSGYINPKHLENFNTLILKEKAYRGFFIHTGKTSDAIRSLYYNNTLIELYGGSKMLELLDDTK